MILSAIVGGRLILPLARDEQTNVHLSPASPPIAGLYMSAAVSPGCHVIISHKAIHPWIINSMSLL